MTRIAAVLMLTFAMALYEASTANATSTTQPHAEFTSTVADFGTVKAGQTVKLEFIFRNTGSAPLVIKQAQHSLRQIKIRFRPETPPGETASVAIELDTNQIAGDISDKITIFLNDPDQPSVVLAVKGVVVPPIDILPRPVVFFSVYEGDTAERSLIVINNQEHPFTISRIEPVGSHFEAVVEPIEAGRRYQLQVTVPSDATLGRYRESLILHTDDPEYAQLGVAVNVLVKRHVYVSREEISFGQVDLAQLRHNPTILPLMTNTFLVKRRDGEMTITSVETDVPFLDIQQDPPERGQTFRFDVGLDMDRIVPGKIDGAIIIKTDDPEFPELTVPVRGKIKE